MYKYVVLHVLLASSSTFLFQYQFLAEAKRFELSLILIGQMGCAQIIP